MKKGESERQVAKLEQKQNNKKIKQSQESQRKVLKCFSQLSAVRGNKLLNKRSKQKQLYNG